MKMADPYMELDRASPSFWCFPCFHVRRWFLYTQYPYDKSIWQKIRTFSWWFLLLISICPVYGVQAYFFVLIFLMIDKSDEFQLVSFILSFKVFQFITIGVMKGVIGYCLYFYCATIYEEDVRVGEGNTTILNPELHNCWNKGPGASMSYFVDIVSFCLQLVLVWVAFFLLPCSKPKGKPKFKYEKLNEENDDYSTNSGKKCCCCTINYNNKRGGKLKYFLIWDFVVFCLCLGLFFAIYYATYDEEKQEDKYAKVLIFFVQTIYGLLSFPFLLLVIPPIKILLIKSRATAYNKYGQCVPANKSVQLIQKLSTYKKDEYASDDEADIDIEEIVKD